MIYLRPLAVPCCAYTSVLESFTHIWQCRKFSTLVLSYSTNMLFCGIPLLSVVCCSVKCRPVTQVAAPSPSWSSFSSTLLLMYVPIKSNTFLMVAAYTLPSPDTLLGSILIMSFKESMTNQLTLLLQ